MFGIGFQELLLIMALALIVIGPKRLPEVAKVIGRAVLDIKKATDELRSSVQVDLRTGDDLQKLKQQYDQVMKVPDITRTLESLVTEPKGPSAPAVPETTAPAPPAADAQEQAPPGKESPPSDEPGPAYRDNEVES